MTHPHDLSLTPLARHALLSLQGGSGKGVGVFSGRVWITEEGGPDDHVLDPGDSMVLRRPGLVIVEALQDSQVILFDTGASAARARPSHAAGASAPSPLSLAEYERIAHDLRRQAMAEAVTRLVRAVVRLFAPPTTPTQRMSRPGRQALAWQPQR